MEFGYKLVLGIILIVGVLIPNNAESTTTPCVCPSITTRTTSHTPSTSTIQTTNTIMTTVTETESTTTPEQSTTETTTDPIATTTTTVPSATDQTASSPVTSATDQTASSPVTSATDQTATATTPVSSATDQTATTTTSVPSSTDHTETTTTSVPSSTDSTATTTTSVPSSTDLTSTATTSVPSSTDSTATTTTSVPSSTDQTSTATTSVPSSTDLTSTATTSVPSSTDLTSTATTSVPSSTDLTSTATISVPSSTDLTSTATTSVPSSTDLTSTATTSVPSSTDLTSTATTSVPSSTDLTSTATTSVPSSTDSTATTTTPVPSSTDPTETTTTSVPSSTDLTSTATTTVPSSTDSTATTTTPVPSSTDSTATAPSASAKNQTITSLTDPIAADAMFGVFNDEDECVCPTDLTTSELPTTMKTTTATTAPGTIQGPALSTLTISIGFSVSIKADFKNKTYDEWKEKFNTTLYQAFENITGFKEVIIKDVRNGSVICIYDLLLDGDANHTLITEQLNDIIESNDTEVDNNYVNLSSMLSTFKKFSKDIGGDGNACKYYNVPYCEVGYNCKINAMDKSTVCTPKCLDHKCYNGGMCVFDQASKNLTCRCDSDEKYTYSGVTCNDKTERLALSSTYIIAIAAGAGGAIIIILLIIIIVLAAKRNQKSESLEKDRFDTLPPLRTNSDAEDSWNFRQNSGTENKYVYKDIRSARNSAFVEDTSAYDMEMYIHSREHDVYTDDNGSKSFLYPSKQTPASSRPYEDLKRRPKSDYDEIGSSLKDFPSQKVDIPRAQIGSVYNSKF